jgi:hypothetical protein
VSMMKLGSRSAELSSGSLSDTQQQLNLSGRRNHMEAGSQKKAEATFVLPRVPFRLSEGSIGISCLAVALNAFLLI